MRIAQKLINVPMLHRDPAAMLDWSNTLMKQLMVFGDLTALVKHPVMPWLPH